MPTLFFYDLETSGFSARHDRIMQFAGQRTNLDLEPIGEPVDLMIKLAQDVLPDPRAIMVTGITPQQTIQDGITEAEFLDYFHDQIALPETIFMGFNSVRFDDEFMRCLLYRNFFDPYEWQWKDGRSRWDLLDVVRMTRALRPDGLTWPTNNAGDPVNKLEVLTTANKLEHANAHDALSDVMATIAVAKLIKQKQPKLYNWLFESRTKQAVKQLVEAGQPFVYTSGKYSKDWLSTSVVAMICPHPDQGGALVYDLRFDPSEYLGLSPEQLVERWRYDPERSQARLPVKVLQYNRCPAIAPLGVFDEASQKRLTLSMATIQKHNKILQANQEFCENLHAALRLMDAARRNDFKKETTADGQIYDGFLDNDDKNKSRDVHHSEPANLTAAHFTFDDKRLNELLPLFKARNFSDTLTDEERLAWEQHRHDRLFAGGNTSRLADYFKKLAELAAEPETANNQFLLEELQLYGQSIMPSDLSA